MSIESVVSKVKAKPGYSLLTENAIGQVTSRALFEKELTLLWNGEFKDFSAQGMPNGYVEPTVEEIQRLYDASTGTTGDPVAVNPYIYGALAYQLFLETATDARWKGFIELQRFTAADSGNPKDAAHLKNMENAAAGLKVSNWQLDNFDSQIKAAGGLPTMAPSSASLSLGIPNRDAVDKALIEVYIGYFNRAPEADGLTYWRGQLDAKMKAGASMSDALTKVASDFWPAASVNYSHITGYSDGMSNFDFVKKVYSNVLGRPDAAQNDASGIQYWVNKLEDHSIATRGEFITSIIGGAHDFIAAQPTDGVSLYVNSYLSNRIDVSSFFAQPKYSGGLTGDSAVNAGIAALSGVTSNSNSVKTSIDTIKAHNPSFSVAQIQLVGTQDPAVQHDIF